MNGIPSIIPPLVTIDEFELETEREIKGPNPLRPITPVSLKGLQVPVREWIVPEWIPCGVVTGLYGDGGLGKSLLAQQLQTAIALGSAWLALPVETGATLGVYCGFLRRAVVPTDGHKRRIRDRLQFAHPCSLAAAPRRR